MTRKYTFYTLLVIFSVLLSTVQVAKAQSDIVAKPIVELRGNSPIINPNALNSFFRRLAAIETRNATRPVVIMQYGDSHTKADLFTGAVRRSLQSEFSLTGNPKQAALQPTAHGSEAIVYQQLGVNGARAKKMQEIANSDAFVRAVGQRIPDLIVLAYGTNEVTDNDWTVDSYERLFEDIVTRCRAAAPQASVLIMGPPDRAVAGNGGWSSVRRMSAMIEAQRRAAFKAGAAYWSACEAMGGAGSMTAWFSKGLAQPDHVHLTVNGYYRLGALFFRDLMDTYQRAGGQKIKRTGPVTAPVKTLSNADLNLMRGLPVMSNSRY